jgi:hypothetical protein
LTPVNRRFVFVVATIALLTAGWFGFRWWQSYSATVWKYLPENSFFVVQSKRLQDSAFRVQKNGVELRDVPLLNLATRQTDLLRLLATDSTRTEQFLKNKTLTYALQKTSGGRFTYLIYVPLAAFEDQNWLEGPVSTRARITSHLHSNQKIFDVSSARSEPLFSYTLFNNFLVVCASGDVLEDWVRFARSPLSATNTSRFESVQQPDSELSIFLDSALLSDVLRMDTSLGENAGLLYFLGFLPGTESFHLDKFFSKKHPTLTSKGKKIKLEGYLGALNDQKGSVLKSTYFIPNNAAICYRLGFDNETIFANNLRKNLEGISTDSTTRSREQLLTLLGKARLDSFYRFLNKELLIFQLEPNNTLTKGQVVLQPIKSNRDLENFYRRLAILFNKNNVVPIEPFQGGYVYDIDWPELPAVLFGELFKGFPKCYVAFNQNHVVYANDRQVLKDYLVDVEYQRTWGNSQLYNTFLKQTLGPSNFTLLINTRKSKQYVEKGFLNYLFNKLNYDITESLPFDHLVFQSAYKKGMAYSSLAFARTAPNSSAKTLNKLFLQRETPFESMPLSGPYMVRNYPNALDKTLLVNANLQLVNPAADDKKRTVIQLNAPIVGDIHSVDFLSIGRLQYVFATQKSLYLVDEDDKQRYTSLPPQGLPEGKNIRSLQRLESGIEGSFRFLVIDTEGFLYLWNSPSQPPTLLNRSRPFADLLLPIHEVEYQGKRHFLFTQATGQVGLIRENGIIPAPYKLDFKTNFSGPFFGVFAPELGSTQLVGISKYGELFEVNLKGQLLNKTQLLRTAPADFFRTRSDANNRDWILLRESATQYAILDKKGKELFAAKGLIPDRNNFEYHFLGADVQFLSIKSGNFTTLYRLNGQQLGDKPIPSDIPIRVSLVEGYNKLLIHSYANKKLQTWSLKIR